MRPSVLLERELSFVCGNELLDRSMTFIAFEFAARIQKMDLIEQEKIQNIS